MIEDFDLDADFFNYEKEDNADEDTTSFAPPLDDFDPDDIEEDETDTSETFKGIDLEDFSMEATRPYDNFEEVKEEDDTLVKPLDFDISSTITAETFDDYSMLAETTLSYPYVVFEAQGKLNTVSGLCSGTLSKGTTQVYFRPSDDENSLIPVVKIATTPINIRNLIRLAKKGTVYYRHTEDSPERLAKPEQFLRFIDINFEDSDEYWNELIENEKNPQVSKQPFFVEDLYS